MGRYSNFCLLKTICLIQPNRYTPWICCLKIHNDYLASWCKSLLWMIHFQGIRLCLSRDMFVYVNIPLIIVPSWEGFVLQTGIQEVKQRLPCGNSGKFKIGYDNCSKFLDNFIWFELKL